LGGYYKGLRYEGKRFFYRGARGNLLATEDTEVTELLDTDSIHEMAASPISRVKHKFH